MLFVTAICNCRLHCQIAAEKGGSFWGACVGSRANTRRLADRRSASRRRGDGSRNGSTADTRGCGREQGGTPTRTAEAALSRLMPFQT